MTTDRQVDYSSLIMMASSLLRGERITDLEGLCEQGTTRISTRKTWKIIQEMREDNRLKAIKLREIADRMVQNAQ